VADARRVVGVIGGMGPEATADFFAKLIAATPAERDQDHLRILIDNDPSVPDRSAGVAGEGPSPAPRLAAMARGLVAAGAELLVMPCNTAHAFVAAIREAAPTVPFVDLIEAAVDASLERVPNAPAVGILATRGTLRAQLYQDGFARRGVDTVLPDEADQRLVDSAIAAVKAGRAGATERAALAGVAARLADAGAALVVTACTELPLLLRDGDVRTAAGALAPIIGSTDALVTATLRAAGVAGAPGASGTSSASARA